MTSPSESEDPPEDREPVASSTTDEPMDDVERQFREGMKPLVAPKCVGLDDARTRRRGRDPEHYIVRQPTPSGYNPSPPSPAASSLGCVPFHLKK